MKIFFINIIFCVFLFGDEYSFFYANSYVQKDLVFDNFEALPGIFQLLPASLQVTLRHVNRIEPIRDVSLGIQALKSIIDPGIFIIELNLFQLHLPTVIRKHRLSELKIKIVAECSVAVFMPFDHRCVILPPEPVNERELSIRPQDRLRDTERPA